MGKAVKWVAGLLIGGACVAALFIALRPQPVPVDVAPVTIGPMQVTVEEDGRTRIRERYVVSSPLVGLLRRITLDPGDRVEAESTVLAVIEPTDPTLLDARSLAEAEGRVRAAEAAVRQAQASLESAKATYDLAEIELARVSSAYKEDAANLTELDRARTEERRAGEERRAAVFSKEIAEYELEVARSAMLFASGDTEGAEQYRMPLYSPISGAVLRLFQESVAVVSPGTPLLEVGDPQDLEIVIDVLSSDGVNIKPGQRVIVEHWGRPEPLEAIVRLVEPSAFTKVSALGIEEQRVNVIADFISSSDQRASLGDGFRIEGSVVTWEQDQTLQVPTSAVFRGGERWSVYVIIDGKAEVRTVEVGHTNARMTEIMSGLAEREEVVLHPSDKLTDGIRVHQRKIESMASR